MALSFRFGRGPFDDLFVKAKNCVLTTTTSYGDPHAHMIRIATCSNDQGAHLWFVIPRECDIAEDVAQCADVTLSVMNSRSMKLVHVQGRATLLGARHDPVYLDHSVRAAPALNVVRDELNFSLLRVDVDESEQPVHSRSELQPSRIVMTPSHLRNFQGG